MKSETIHLPTPTPPSPGALRPTVFDALRARLMFVLGFAYLLLVAGLVHRATTLSVTAFELDVMAIGVAFLWPIFVAEALWQLHARDRTKPRKPFIWRTVLVVLMPPWRMAMADSRTGLVWIPRMGWVAPGKDLFKRLDLVFSGPMLLFAFLILPLLIFEYVQSAEVKSNPAMALALDIGIAVIWVAFATEFIFKASVHPKPWQFAKERWLDVAIVVLPMLEYVLTKWVDAAPLARLLRLGRAISPEQIARMQRLYRLQGLATKAWHALLLLEGVARLLGQTPEKRLAKLEEKIAELEEELAELKKDAETVRALIPPAAEATAQNQPDAASGGRTGEPSGEVVIASNLPSGP
jgi:hypothetical protein